TGPLPQKHPGNRRSAFAGGNGRRADDAVRAKKNPPGPIARAGGSPKRQTQVRLGLPLSSMARKRSNIQVLEKIRAAASLCGFFVLCLDIRHCIRYNSLALSDESFKLLKYEVRELPKEAAIWMIIALYIAAM